MLRCDARLELWQRSGRRLLRLPAAARGRAAAVGVLAVSLGTRRLVQARRLTDGRRPAHAAPALPSLPARRHANVRTLRVELETQPNPPHDAPHPFGRPVQQQHIHTPLFTTSLPVPPPPVPRSAEAYFAGAASPQGGGPALHEAFRQLAAWATPRAAEPMPSVSTVELPLLGHTLALELIPARSGPACAVPCANLGPATAHVAERSAVAAVRGLGGLTWTLWQLLLCGESVIVLAPDPGQARASPTALARIPAPPPHPRPATTSPPRRHIPAIALPCRHPCAALQPHPAASSCAALRPPRPSPTHPVPRITGHGARARADLPHLAALLHV